jgi:hypothetical protein
MTALARWAAVGVLALAGSAATAQTIYRCGHSYSRDPCPSARAIEVEGRPTAAQRAEGRQVALREKRLADEMVRGRRLAEASQKPALATSLGPARVAAAAPTPHRKASKKKRKATASDDSRDFIAAVPKAAKAPP